MNHTEQETIAIGAPGSAMRRIMSAPEIDINQRFTRYDVEVSTPWGTSQSACTFRRGIIQYSTAGHGGFHVAPTLLKQMPEYLRGDAYAPEGWFEEDCAWAMVAISFPELFNLFERECAVSTMKHYYPEQWAKFCQPA